MDQGHGGTDLDLILQLSTRSCLPIESKTLGSYQPTGFFPADSYAGRLSPLLLRRGQHYS